MSDIKKEILNRFEGSDLGFESPSISARYNLRYELGLGYENGTQERVLQAQERASVIFRDLFDPEDIIIVATFNAATDDLEDFWKIQKKVFSAQLKHESILKSWYFKENKIENDEFWDEEKNALQDFVVRWCFEQNFYMIKVKDINVQNIFLGIANVEMGFDPKIDVLPYFINLSKAFAFYMYDDRGCLILSDNKEFLAPYYKKYNEWLVDYHRPYFDEIFG